MPPKKRPRDHIVKFNLDNVCEEEFAKQVNFIKLEDHDTYEKDFLVLHTQQQKEDVNTIQRRIKREYGLNPTSLNIYNKTYQSTWNTCSKTPTKKNYETFLDAYNNLKEKLIALVAAKKLKPTIASSNFAPSNNSENNNNNNATSPQNLTVTQQVTNITNVTNVYNYYTVSGSRFFLPQQTQPTAVKTMTAEEEAIEVLSSRFEPPIKN